MKSSCCLCLICLVLLLPAVSGAGLKQGIEAYNSGDYVTALELFEVLASEGDDQAQLLIGLMYDNGLGTTMDPGMAFLWYRRAAVQGNARAQFNVAEMLAGGQGVERDRIKAAEWYHRAAENGYAEAQYKLGLALASGDGISKDLVEAWKWLDIAASAENVEGNEVARFARGELSLRMDDAGVREARERSRQWQESFMRKREEKLRI